MVHTQSQSPEWVLHKGAYVPMYDWMVLCYLQGVLNETRKAAAAAAGAAVPSAAAAAAAVPNAATSTPEQQAMARVGDLPFTQVCTCACIARDDALIWLLVQQTRSEG